MENSKKTILIVDDDPEIRNFLNILVDSNETVVRFAGSISEAKAVIRNEQVDLIFLDLFLPDGYGLDLLDSCSELRSADRPCMIIMSAFGDWQDYLSAFEREAFYFLEKPFKVTKVRSLLEDAFQKAAIH